MTFVFTDSGLTVTTWRCDESGAQIWRARTADDVVEFKADRNADVEELLDKAQKALAKDEETACI